jgi:solute carrier family 13 (sodium-dependent dicarboxylate transporter), member 2/3/5
MQSTMKTALPLILLLCIGLSVIFGLPGLGWSGKVALLIFTGALYAWTNTKLDATLVALLGAVAMSLAGITGGRLPLAGLGDPFIGFVISGFILGGAYKATGLSGAIANWFAKRSSSVVQLFFLLTAALLLLSFVVPSTSARAAMLMPSYLAMANATDNPRIRKALAVLFPTVIVLSCITSYLGAGANLMTVDFIKQFSGEKISYLDWLMLGGPFGIISCLLSVLVITRVFLTAEDRKSAFEMKSPQGTDLTPEAKKIRNQVLGLSALMIGLWSTEQWHGIDPALVAMSGALILCIPQLGILSFKQALKEVEWSMVVFMAASIELSKGLSGSGLTNYLSEAIQHTFSSFSGMYMLVAILITALLSHLFVHSRTARAAVFMPLLIPLGLGAGHSGLLVAFFSNAAMGYCLTLPICAKPVAMFSAPGGEEAYSTGDLLKLSFWLLPLHFVLLLLAFAIYG